jgi:hypothetical protein
VISGAADAVIVTKIMIVAAEEHRTADAQEGSDGDSQEHQSIC